MEREEYLTNLKKSLDNPAVKYHLVFQFPFGESPREYKEDFKIKKAYEAVQSFFEKEGFDNKNVILSGAIMIRDIAYCLELSPSALIIPHGHADINLVKNLETRFGEKGFPKIPVFESFKYERPSKEIYRWLKENVLPNPLRKN